MTSGGRFYGNAVQRRRFAASVAADNARGLWKLRQGGKPELLPGQSQQCRRRQTVGCGFPLSRNLPRVLAENSMRLRQGGTWLLPGSAPWKSVAAMDDPIQKWRARWSLLTELTGEGLVRRRHPRRIFGNNTGFEKALRRQTTSQWPAPSCVASRKASMTVGLLSPRWPFQSDHSFGSAMLAIMVMDDWFPVSSCRLLGLDYQNWV
jgi:hypothetical protein